MPTVIRKLFTEETEEELMNMTRQEACLYLSDRQKKFCEAYVSNFNIKLAAIKAGYSKQAAHGAGWRLRQVPEVNRYIAWLKLRVSRESHVDAMDIIDMYVRIAFQDITDFVEVKDNRLTLIDSGKIDGQLVKSLKQGRDGISIELSDRLAALDKLERYFDVMPKDWKQKIEEKKLELMKEKLDIERQKLGDSDMKQEDDGFIEALKGAATSVWEDETEDEDNSFEEDNSENEDDEE